MVSRNEETLGVIVLILSQTVGLLRRRTGVTKRSNEPANFRKFSSRLIACKMAPGCAARTLDAVA
jgi:hypothetical protein